MSEVELGDNYANQSLYYANVLIGRALRDQLIHAHIASKKHIVCCQMCGGLPEQVICFILKKKKKKLA